jgi:hypothetical protein
MIEERRCSPRVEIDHEVRVTAGEQSLTGRLTSTSRLGAGIELEQTFSVGTPLSLRVDLPGPEGALELRSQVVRAEASGGRIALAVMFVPLTPAALSRIDALLAAKPRV